MCSGVLHEGHRHGPEERRVLLQQVFVIYLARRRHCLPLGSDEARRVTLRRAAAHSKLGNYTEATGDCERAIGIDPTYSKAYGRMG